MHICRISGTNEPICGAGIERDAYIENRLVICFYSLIFSLLSLTLLFFSTRMSSGGLRDAKPTILVSFPDFPSV